MNYILMRHNTSIFAMKVVELNPPLYMPISSLS